MLRIRSLELVVFILILINGIAFSQGSLLLLGGGGEDSLTWSDEPYGWFVEQAGYGIIVNIDADDIAPFYADYFRFLGADENSFSLQIPSRTAANDSATYYQLISAQGIFIEGGNQWDYVSNWKGTLVEDAIHYVFNKGGAIGGTSAGLAVLGEVVFDAEFGSSYPEDAAYNPYHPDISLTDDFLKVLPNVITDSHFHRRGRIGRLIPMIARSIQDSGQDSLIGIGISEQTAFCLDSNLIGTVYGKSSVSIVYPTEKSIINCQPNIPVTFTHIGFDQLIHGTVYDLKTKTLVDPGPYLSVAGPVPDPVSYTDVAINGSDEATKRLGDVEFTNILSDRDLAREGSLVYTNGDSVIGNTIIMPNLWSDYQFYENRIIAGMYGLAKNPHLTSIYLDENCIDSLNADGILTVKKLTYIIDSYGASHFGVSRAVRTNYSGIIGAQLHFLGPDEKYDLNNHQSVTGIREKQSGLPKTGMLYQNYPNPFNPQTTLRYELPRRGYVQLSILDILGNRLETLVENIQGAGTHQITWDASGYSSGLYVVCMEFHRHKSFRKALLLK